MAAIRYQATMYQNNGVHNKHDVVTSLCPSREQKPRVGGTPLSALITRRHSALLNLPPASCTPFDLPLNDTGILHSITVIHPSGYVLLDTNCPQSNPFLQIAYQPWNLQTRLVRVSGDLRSVSGTRGKLKTSQKVRIAHSWAHFASIPS